MKMMIILGMLVLSGAVSALEKDKQLSCGLVMYQFKTDKPIVPLIGDTNQRVSLNLVQNIDGVFDAEAQVRFLNDQSGDPTNSLHGVRVIASSTEGRLALSLSILKYQTKEDASPFEAISTAVASSSEDAVREINFGYLNPKAPDPIMDLLPLVDTGKVKDYELYVVEVRNCWFVQP